MSWREHHISDWDGFRRFVDKHATLTVPGKAPLMCRGVANAEWDLCPSFARHARGLSRAQALKAEEYALEHFVAAAALFADEMRIPLPRKRERLEWLSIMQHFGSPTRLLDWTVSIYVAAYFAVERAFENDGAIWVAALRPLRVATDPHFGSGVKPNVARVLFDGIESNQLYAMGITPHNPRSFPQQGIYTICANPLADHAVVIEEAMARRPEFPDALAKLVIPSAQKADFLQRLRHMNVTASSLFPGPEGLGRSTGELVRLICNFPSTIDL